MTVGAFSEDVPLRGYLENGFGELSKIPYWWVESSDGSIKEKRILTTIFSNTSQQDTYMEFTHENTFTNISRKTLTVKVTPSGSDSGDILECYDLNEYYIGSAVYGGMVIPTEIGTKVTLTFAPPPMVFYKLGV